MADTTETTADPKAGGTPQNPLEALANLNGLLDALGVTDFGDRALITTLGIGGDTTRLREIIATKSPDELVDAFIAADPDSAPILEALREDPDVLKSIHEAIVKDPSVLKGLQGGDNEGGINPAMLKAALADENISSSLAALFTKVAEKPNDEYTFDTVKGIMVLLEKGDVDAANAELQEMGITSEIELTPALATAYFATLTPDQALEKIAEEAGIEIPEAAKNDPAFKEALYKALTKDPSVMEGLLSLKSEDGKPSEFATDLQSILADDQKRQVLTKMLDTVGKHPDDKFNFEYMVDFADAVKKDDKAALLRMLREIGADVPIDEEQLLAAFGQYINDPIGSAPMLVELLGFDPNSAQGQAYTQIFEAIGSYIEMIIGGPTGYRAVAQAYLPGFMEDTGQLFMDAVGYTDAEEKITLDAQATARVQAERDRLAGTGRGIPYATPLEGDKFNPVANITLKDSWVLGLERSFEAGFPKPDPVPQGVDLRSDEQKLRDMERVRMAYDTGGSPIGLGGGM